MAVTMPNGFRPNITDEDIVRLSRSYARSVRNYEDREDIAQDISVALLRARKRFDPFRGSWIVYAHHLAIGVVRDYYRTYRIDGKQWNRHDHEIGARYTSYDELLHEVAAPLNDDTELVRTLQEFPERERRMILCLILGYTRTEIARLLGISTSRVSSIIGNLRFMNFESSNYPLRD